MNLSPKETHDLRNALVAITMAVSPLEDSVNAYELPFLEVIKRNAAHALAVLSAAEEVKD